jgi:hypothetical protein
VDSRGLVSRCDETVGPVYCHQDGTCAAVERRQARDAVRDGKTIERNRILTTLWGSDNYFNSRSLSVYVNHLRKLMGKDNGAKIMSVHGKGYKLVIMAEQNA